MIASMSHLYNFSIKRNKILNYKLYYFINQVTNKIFEMFKLILIAILCFIFEADASKF